MDKGVSPEFPSPASALEWRVLAHGLAPTGSGRLLVAMPGCTSVPGWVGFIVQIQEKGSSEADIGLYFPPESLCLSLTESNLEGDRRQGVAALAPLPWAAGSVHAWLPRSQDREWMVRDEAGRVNQCLRKWGMWVSSSHTISVPFLPYQISTPPEAWNAPPL